MKSDLSDNQAITGHTAEPQTNKASHSAAEKVRRYRERRKAGILVVSVEIKPELLEFVAWGTGTSVEALKADRTLLAKAIQRAVKQLMLDRQARGSYLA
jgi:hypothetical protein